MNCTHTRQLNLRDAVDSCTSRLIIIFATRMFAQVHYPEKLLSTELDQYLEKGWFRMGQTIFTTNFLHFKSQFYSAIWLRVDLKMYTADKIQNKLFRQNARFQVKIGQVNLDVTKEALFARYKQGISFEASPSLYHLLFGKSIHNVYNTFEVNVFDGDNLIAVGIFDIGRNAAAGITSFYDPAYRKYSLGKFLIYLKMNYCQQLGLQYFYPGYFVPGYSFFDYKLELGKSALEFLNVSTEKWLPIAEFETSPYNVMYERLKTLQLMLAHLNIETQLFKYEFFDANLFPELKDAVLFDFPLFLNCFAWNEFTINPMITYDVRDAKFHLVQCRSIWTSNLAITADEVYSYNLLKVEEEWYATESIEQMVSRMQAEAKYKLW